MALILVIEDNAENMELSVLLLKKIGHNVLSAVDAESGLAMVHMNRPDLILMDIQLPGMDGLEATRLLKQDGQTQHIPVIALSALVMKGDEDRIRAAGCIGYISKPLNYKEFWQVIESHLPARQAPSINKDG